MNMKNIIIRLSLFCVLAGMGASCSKKIDEAYMNPNADVKVPVETLLPQMISAMAGNYAGHGTMTDIRYVGAYIQNFSFYATLSVFDRMGYTNSAGDVAQSTWRMHYYDIGQNNVQMIKWATEEEKWDYVGVGQAIFAWSWLTLTDYYGDVILKEAFNTELITFKYDKQEDVYLHVRDLALQAVANLSKPVAGSTLAQGDAYMYGGDVNKWKKFAYGVLARYYNHQTNKPNYKADSAVYYANLAMSSVAEDAMVKFAATALSATNNFFGPLRSNLTGTTQAAPTAIRQADYIARLMAGQNVAFSVEDPRAWYMLRGNKVGTIRGVPPVKGQTVLPLDERPENFWGFPQHTITSNAAPTVDSSRYIFKNDAPFPIMTSSEMKFIIAEAEYRRGNKAAALAAYQQGISLSFDMLTTYYNRNITPGKEITPAMKAAFLSNPNVVPTNMADFTLNKIMLQKYIAMFGHGVLETWVDMRRYHYTDTESGVQVYTEFTPPSGTDLFPDNNGKLVYRMRPRFNSEYVWNILELQRIGATTNDYHTMETWFSMP